MRLSPIAIRRKAEFLLRPVVQRWGRRQAERYAQAVGLNALLQPGDGTEIAPQVVDLAYLHRQIRERKPRCVVEFGVGFSTLVIADALQANGQGHLWSVDADRHWLDNTRAKLPERLCGVVTFLHAVPRLMTINGQLCHLFDALPDVEPDFIYLDGPHPSQVEGTINGLSMNCRTETAADPLLYESTLRERRGCFMLVDGRWNNVAFLRTNLKRSWRVRENRFWKRTTFELLP